MDMNIFRPFIFVLTSLSISSFIYNEELKNAGVIDLPTWRHIQLLGDLRNLCCHDKKSEPTKDQAKDLLDGTTKICKTVY